MDADVRAIKSYQLKILFKEGGAQCKRHASLYALKFW